MALKLAGTITAIVRAEDQNTKDKDENEYEKIEIPSADFALEEDGMRNIGDGDYQYEALYVYNYDDDAEISFQAVNFKGQITVYPYEIKGKIKIIDDNLSVEPVVYDEQDFF